MAKGLDVGTSFVVLAEDSAGEVAYKDFRDAFYVIKPTTPVATKMIEKGLAGKVFVKDSDGSFILLGQDAIEKAVERNDSAKRPMYKGVVSPKEKDAKRILAYILKEVAGQSSVPGEKIVFCIPAQPVDQEDEDFDVGYHEDTVKAILSDVGYSPKAINEAEALCYSEFENDDYTGVGLSWGAGMVNCCVMLNGEPTVMFSTTKCLAKNTLIATSDGLKPISEITVGDTCTDHTGKLARVLAVLNNGPRETMISISVANYSEPVVATPDHKLWVKKAGAPNWAWHVAEQLVPGDSLGVPIIKPDCRDMSRALYAYRVDGDSVFLPKSRAFGRFIGSFLGDGSAYIVQNNKSDGRVTCAFNTKHADTPQHMARYKACVAEVFNKDTYDELRESESCVVCRFHSISVTRFLKKLCFNPDTGAKQLQLSPHDIPHQMALGIIEGLLATDGWRYNAQYLFENTSSSLCVLLQDLLARFGVRTSFTVRPPRVGGKNKHGVSICGRKPVYRIQVGRLVDNHTLEFLMQQDAAVNLPITDSDFMLRKITDVVETAYNDDVYDLVMDGDTHSFSCPAGALHNSGDWVDRMASVAVNEPDSVVQAEKEHGVFVVGEPNDNPILSAVSSYYERLIEYTAKQLAAALTGHKLLPKFKNPLPIAVAGGTSKAAGFVALFAKKLAENNFPLAIKEVRHANDPLHAVARGCLIAAKIL